MRLKILLVGTQKSVIDDFFNRKDLDIICMSSSMRIEDIETHLDIFQPHFILFCMNTENADSIRVFRDVKFICERDHVNFAIFGKPEDCTFFKKTLVNVADVALSSPMSLLVIVSKLEEYYKSLHEGLTQETQNSGAAMDDIGVSNEIVDNVLAKMAGITLEAKEEPVPVPAQAEKKHVLVVDDDPNMLKLIKMHLESRYEVATAISGSLALRFLATKTTDLVLLDYEMPGEDGVDVLKKIRQKDSMKDIPVIFLTGITDTSKIRLALSYKPDGYLLKPIDKEKLLAAIQERIG